MVVTGPRFWDDFSGQLFERREALIRSTLRAERHARGEFTLVHGNAKGVDRMCASAAHDLGIEAIAVPYFGWLRGGGGPARNRFMLTAYVPRMLHGFHEKTFEELPRPGSGTADCVAQAVTLLIPVTFHVIGRCTQHFLPRLHQESLL